MTTATTTSIPVRKVLRAVSTVLIVAGALMMLDAGLTVAWQEPVSALYTKYKQSRLGDDLDALERAKPTPLQRRALRALDGDRRRMAFLARSLKRTARRGQAVGRLRIGRIGSNQVIVKGTDPGDLRNGPGIYDQTPFPGAPGTVGIAGHRTTYGAPFRKLDKVRAGDEISVRMPYGVFTYRVERKRIVKPTQISVIDRVSFDRLVLSACHPLYSAAKRIVVFARLEDAEPRGAALQPGREAPARKPPGPTA